MLSKAQEKIIKSLQTKKGREKSGLCLVEGEKVVKAAGSRVEYVFGPADTAAFSSLTTTDTPPKEAAVARLPIWEEKDIFKKDIIVVLDNVQDPGNVGAIFRLCLGFGASLILVEAADPASPKVIRSSAGNIFSVPWLDVSREEAVRLIEQAKRPAYRLENKAGAREILEAKIKKPAILIAGSEGQGINEKMKGDPIFIRHDSALESLNVSQALAIALYQLRIRD